MADVWAVVTKDGCPWCESVAKLMAYCDIEYREVNITNDQLLRAFIREDLGLKSVPQVFHNGHLVGGYEDTVTYMNAFLTGEEQLEFKFD